MFIFENKNNLALITADIIFKYFSKKNQFNK